MIGRLEGIRCRVGGRGEEPHDMTQTVVSAVAISAISDCQSKVCRGSLEHSSTLNGSKGTIM